MERIQEGEEDRKDGRAQEEDGKGRDAQGGSEEGGDEGTLSPCGSEGDEATEEGGMRSGGTVRFVDRWHAVWSALECRVVFLHVLLPFVLEQRENEREGEGCLRASMMTMIMFDICLVLLSPRKEVERVVVLG